MSEVFLLISVCFFGMLTPGPDFILVTRNALMYPRQQGLATAVGIIVGCFVHATYCILGLAFVIAKSVVLYSIIKYAGAAYLCYIGIKAITSKPASSDVAVVPTAKIPTVMGAFAQGFLCNVLNPKLAIFLLSLFTQFISIDATMAQKFMVASIFVGESALYWPILVLVLQSPVVQKIFSDFKVAIDRVSGGFLIYLGARVALSRG